MLDTVARFLLRHRRVVLALLVCLQVGLLVDLAARVAETADERTWLLVGRSLVRGDDWVVPEQRLQGPLGLLANQLLAGAIEPAMFGARLGMLLFPVGLLLVAERFARQAWGSGAGLLAAVLVALSPTVLGNGALLANDVALATTALLSGYLLWRWLLDPSWLRALALGAALGAMLATKFSALVIAAGVPLVVAIALVRGFDPRPAGGRRPAAVGLAVVHLALAGVVALVVLHAAYLFRGGAFGFAAAHDLASPALRAVARVPGGTLLLAVLPDPLVRGADFQAVASVAYSGRFLDTMGGDVRYYPASLLTKVALPILLLFGASFVWRPATRARFAGLCLGGVGLVLLGYLMFANSLQGGVRYVLPVLAAMIVRAGAFAGSGAAATTPGRIGIALACLWLAVGTLRGHPHELGSFNELVGGPAGGWRWFQDINCDWGQERAAGREAIAARHPDVRFLGPADGPCFGTVAAYVLDLAPPDPERPGHTWHWLDRFEPIDHHSAAWLVFAPTPEAFAAAARAGDPRASRDLALAWLAAGDRERARAALELPGDGKAAVGHILDLLDALGDRTDVPERWRAVIQALSALGRDDLAARYLDRAPKGSAAEMFLTLVRGGREREAVALLESAAAERRLTVAEAMMLATAQLQGGRPADAHRTLAAADVPAAGDPLAAPWRTLHDQVERTLRLVREFGDH